MGAKNALGSLGAVSLVIAFAACRPRGAEPEKPKAPPAQDAFAGTVLAAEDADIGAVALDATHVYWLEDAGKDTAIFRVPKAGGAAPMKVATASGGCQHLAVDDSRVYCLADKGIFAAPKEGGADATGAPGVMFGPPMDCLACAIALDGADIYFSHPGGLGKIAKTGGTATVFAADRVTPNAIAVTPTHVFWSTPIRAEGNASIKSAAKATGKVETLVADARTLSADYPIFVDGDHVYYVVGSVLNSVPIKGGESKEALVMIGAGYGVAMDHGDVFWGTEVKRIGAPHKEEVTPLVGDPTRRREVTTGGGRAQGEGGLMKRAKAATSAAPMIPDHHDVAAVAVDATSVYWVEKNERKIRKLAR